MKKYILLLILLPFLIGCSSSDDEDNDDDNNVLVGTSWKGRHSSGEAISYYIYSFESNTECEAEFSTFEDFSTSGKGKRLYEYKNNILIIKSLTNQTLATGTVDLENGKIYFQDRYGTSTFYKLD